MTRFGNLVRQPWLSWFVGLARFFFFFLIKLDYLIVYFYFYHIVKKIVLEKNILLNFRKLIHWLVEGYDEFKFSLFFL